MPTTDGNEFSNLKGRRSRDAVKRKSLAGPSALSQSQSIKKKIPRVDQDNPSPTQSSPHSYNLRNCLLLKSVPSGAAKKYNLSRQKKSSHPSANTNKSKERCSLCSHFIPVDSSSLVCYSCQFKYSEPKTYKSSRRSVIKPVDESLAEELEVIAVVPVIAEGELPLVDGPPRHKRTVRSKVSANGKGEGLGVSKLGSGEEESVKVMMASKEERSIGKKKPADRSPVRSSKRIRHCDVARTNSIAETSDKIVSEAPKEMLAATESSKTAVVTRSKRLSSVLKKGSLDGEIAEKYGNSDIEKTSSDKCAMVAGAKGPRERIKRPAFVNREVKTYECLQCKEVFIHHQRFRIHSRKCRLMLDAASSDEDSVSILSNSSEQGGNKPLDMHPKDINLNRVNNEEVDVANEASIDNLQMAESANVDESNEKFVYIESSGEQSSEGSDALSSQDKCAEMLQSDTSLKALEENVTSVEVISNAEACLEVAEKSPHNLCAEMLQSDTTLGVVEEAETQNPESYCSILPGADLKVTVTEKSLQDEYIEMHQLRNGTALDAVEASVTFDEVSKNAESFCPNASESQESSATGSQELKVAGKSWQEQHADTLLSISTLKDGEESAELFGDADLEESFLEIEESTSETETESSLNFEEPLMNLEETTLNAAVTKGLCVNVTKFNLDVAKVKTTQSLDVTETSIQGKKAISEEPETSLESGLVVTEFTLNSCSETNKDCLEKFESSLQESENSESSFQMRGDSEFSLQKPENNESSLQKLETSESVLQKPKNGESSLQKSRNSLEPNGKVALSKVTEFNLEENSSSIRGLVTEEFSLEEKENSIGYFEDNLQIAASSIEVASMGLEGQNGCSVEIESPLEEFRLGFCPQIEAVFSLSGVCGESKVEAEAKEEKSSCNARDLLNNDHDADPLSLRSQNREAKDEPKAENSDFIKLSSTSKDRCNILKSETPPKQAFSKWNEYGISKGKTKPEDSIKGKEPLSFHNHSVFNKEVGDARIPKVCRSCGQLLPAPTQSNFTTKAHFIHQNIYFLSDITCRVCHNKQKFHFVVSSKSIKNALDYHVSAFIDKNEKMTRKNLKGLPDYFKDIYADILAGVDSETSSEMAQTSIDSVSTSQASDVCYQSDTFTSEAFESTSTSSLSVVTDDADLNSTGSQPCTPPPMQSTSPSPILGSNSLEGHVPPVAEVASSLSTDNVNLNCTTNVPYTPLLSVGRPQSPLSCSNSLEGHLPPVVEETGSISVLADNVNLNSATNLPYTPPLSVDMPPSPLSCSSSLEGHMSPVAEATSSLSAVADTANLNSLPCSQPSAPTAASSEHREVTFTQDMFVPFDLCRKGGSSEIYLCMKFESAACVQPLRKEDIATHFFKFHGSPQHRSTFNLLREDE